MRKVFWVLVATFWIFVAGVEFGYPASLVCDWQPGVIASEVEVNGTVVPGTVVQSGTDMVLLDLAGYANGAYRFRARFIGTGGWPSDWSAPFDAEKPASGGVLRIKR